jgi:hypothetical protein
VLAGVLWVDSAVCAVVCEGLGAVLKLGMRLWWCVVNDVVDVDGGCAAVDSGDVAASTDASRRVTRAVGAGLRLFSV